MKITAIALALSLAVVAAPAFAGMGEDHEGKMDCPMHDKSMSDTDRAEHMDGMFAKLDADGNGSIDRAEFDRFHEHMRHEHDEHGEHADQAPARDAHADADQDASDHAAHH